MRVYRIADGSNKGPYSSHDAYNLNFRHHNAATGRPSPSDDGIKWDHVAGMLRRAFYHGHTNGIEDLDNLLFGFKSLSALYKWFREDISPLVEKEFFIYIIEIEEEWVKAGKSGQVCFVYPAAKVLKQTKLPETLDKAKNRVRIRKKEKTCS